MNSGIIFALVLAAIFFGGIIWLVIHARRQERQAVPVRDEAAEEERPDGSAHPTRQPSLRVAAGAGTGARHSKRAKLR
ncbi:MAG: hypothetical protein ICV60_23200 [Pyrinomonadaceae bacterium]|nr:hypothetical protein [Pyrinomonadaceae bacterium]